MGNKIPPTMPRAVGEKENLMSHSASFIVTKNGVLWLPDSGNPSVLLDKETEFVRVKLSPPTGELYDIPLSKWRFLVDEYRVPEWWNVEEGERSCREELKAWVRAHTITGDVDEITRGALRFVFAGSPKVGVNAGCIHTYGSSNPVIEENVGVIYACKSSGPVIEENTGYVCVYDSSRPIIGENAGIVHANSSSNPVIWENTGLIETQNGSKPTIMGNKKTIKSFDNSRVVIVNNMGDVRVYGHFDPVVKKNIGCVRSLQIQGGDIDV